MERSIFYRVLKVCQFLTKVWTLQTLQDSGYGGTTTDKRPNNARPQDTEGGDKENSSPNKRVSSPHTPLPPTFLNIYLYSSYSFQQFRYLHDIPLSFHTMYEYIIHPKTLFFYPSPSSRADWPYFVPSFLVAWQMLFWPTFLPLLYWAFSSPDIELLLFWPTFLTLLS